MSKPPFDPNQPFASAKPEFDPNAPFTPGDQSQSQPAPSFGDAAMSALKSLNPLNVAKNLTPEKLSAIPGVLPTAGAAYGALAGPAGMAAGAGVGQTLSRMADIGYGRAQPESAGSNFALKEAIGPMVQTAVAGLPETSAAKSAVNAIGRGLAKTGKTLTGVKEDVLKQAYDQGLSTYAAPSMEKAQDVFGKAVGPEGQKALQQTADEVFDPSLGKARSLAKEVGTKMDAFLAGSGEPPTALEALQAKQATDRIISSTSVTDKMARRALYDYRSKFDALMQSQSGALGDASKLYRQAIVKNTLLNPTRLTKSGEPSAFLPLVLGAGGRSAEGVVNTLVGTSPALWGLGATTAGSVSRSPLPQAGRAALAAFIDKFTTKRNQ